MLALCDYFTAVPLYKIIGSRFFVHTKYKCAALGISVTRIILAQARIELNPVPVESS